MKTIFFLIIILMVVPISACSQVLERTSKSKDTAVKSSPIIRGENSRGKTFVAPDGSFQIDLLANKSEVIQELTFDDIKIDGTGTRFSWNSGNLYISIKSVYSENFPYSDSQSGREKFWRDNLEQVKGFEIQGGAKIVAERDLTSDSYFGRELKEISAYKNISFARYYYNGKRFVTVLAFVTDRNLESEAEKYLSSFKLLK